jgi:predicted metal-dependent phosphoesterase TrpH
VYGRSRRCSRIRRSRSELLVDLHNHTDHSPDSRIRQRDYERAHARGRFDIVAITDHNTIAGALELRERASFPVIVGQEIDTTDGELIGLYLEAAVPIGRSAVETAELIHAQGGLVYLQHPFYHLVRGRLRPEAREELRGRRLLDIVEACNGGPWAAAGNARALQWARACDLPHAASSDAHEPAAIGSCLSVVPDGHVDAASLPGLLRSATVIDRRSPAPVAIARHFASRARSELAVRLGLEPRRMR